MYLQLKHCSEMLKRENLQKKEDSNDKNGFQMLSARKIKVRSALLN